jgi:type I restriction enzyme M protein
MTGDELLKSFVDNKLFPQLQNLQPNGDSNTPSAFVVRGVFEDAYNYMKSGQLLRQVINKIQLRASTSTRPRSATSSATSTSRLLRDLQNAGNAGEYYTPRPVTAVHGATWSTRKLEEKVMDPACGTGGFLTCAIEHTCASTLRQNRRA